MPSRPRQHRPARLAIARAEADRAMEARRGTAAERGYDSRWRKGRDGFLAKHPLCAYHALFDPGRIAFASLVDHLYPHGGDKRLFWLREYWVGSCVNCHSKHKQAVEHGGLAALDALAGRLGLRPLGETHPELVAPAAAALAERRG